MTSKTEIWKPHPEYTGTEVSTFGRIRTLDRVVPCRGNGTRLVKGRVLKPASDRGGYLTVAVKVNDKFISKKVHRLVAQAFIPNPDGLPEINHKDNNPLNNGVSNLEWCTHEYNMAYKEKYGKTAKESAPKLPVYAVNLKTQEILWFESRMEAGRVLGFCQGHISMVIKGKYKQTNGYWFTNADAKAADVIKHKLEEM